MHSSVLVFWMYFSHPPETMEFEVCFCTDFGHALRVEARMFSQVGNLLETILTF